MITNFADILIFFPNEVILLHCTFSQSMKWTEEHELLMLRELMLLQPWLHKKGTSERGDIGKSWQYP